MKQQEAFDQADKIIAGMKREARAAALEEAARVCDESEAYALADYEIAMRRGEKEDAVRFSAQQRVARAMAAAIRDLKEARCSS